MTQDPIIAYCVSCKEKREMKAPEAVFTKTGTPGTKGTCTVCDTGMFKMGWTDAHEGLPKPPPVAPKKKASKTKKKKTKRTRRSGKLVIVESPAKARTIGV